MNARGNPFPAPDPSWRKKHCDYHDQYPSEEAEVTRVTAKATYVMLRCPKCYRIRGERRVVTS